MISFTEVSENLRYDPGTGLFWWKIRKGGRPFGRPAGTSKKGQYVYIKMGKTHYTGHRLAWLLQTGKWPKEIDHKNGEPSDNRWRNLRVATRSQNNGNMRHRRNKSAYKGVTWHAGARKWRAAIQCNKKRYWLGYFPSAKKAHAAYLKMAVKLFGEFARGS